MRFRTEPCRKLMHTGFRMSKIMIYSGFKGVCVLTIRLSGAAGWPLKGRGIVYRARMMAGTLRFMTVHGWRWEEEPESDACHQTRQNIVRSYLNLIASPLQVTLSEHS